MKIPFLNLFRARDKPRDAVSAATTFFFGSSASGKSVNPKNAVQVSTVYACVRVIAETIASLPVGVYETTANGSQKSMDHPLYRLLHDEPNPEMTSFVWRETTLSHLLLWGNAYSQIIRSGKSHILALYPLLPDRMEVDRDSSGRLTYTYTTTEGGTVQLRPEDVLHIPGLGFDGIMGYSPIALEKNAIGLGIAAEEYGSTFFKNGARPSGILTHPNTVKDPKRLRESWNAAYGGSSNGSKVAILEENMSFTPISLPNNEAQFLETRKFQVEEICRIFRVPPHLIGDLSRSTFSNIEHQSIDFATHMISCTLNNRKYTVDFITGRALREMEPAAKMYSRIVALSNAALKGETPEDAKELSIGEAMDVMIRWFCILFGNQFTPDDVLDHYPVDRLMHDIALALMAVQTQTTSILDEFPTKAARTEAGAANA